MLGLACDDAEIVDDGDASEVEQVLAGAAVAGAAALPVPDVGEKVAAVHDTHTDSDAEFLADFTGILDLIEAAASRGPDSRRNSP